MSEWLWQVDWEALFIPDTPILEIFIRGTCVYLGLFILLRLILKRQSGTVSITDLLVLVLIADASQNAMAANYKSIPDGLLLVATIIFWNFVLEWLDFHVPFLHRAIYPSPLLLVKDGKMLRKNMQKELITRAELFSQLREQGAASLKEVKSAVLEGNGHISVIKYERTLSRKRKRTNV